MREQFGIDSLKIQLKCPVYSIRMPNMVMDPPPWNGHNQNDSLFFHITKDCPLCEDWEGLSGEYNTVTKILTINGSMAKFFLGQNFDGITLKDIPNLTKELTRGLGVDETDLLSARIKVVDFGITISLSDIPHEYISRFLDIKGRHVYSRQGSLGRTLDYRPDGSSGLTYNTKDWLLRLYNKGSESKGIAPDWWKGKNALKMEVSLRSVRKFRKVFSVKKNILYRDLYRPDTWRKMIYCFCDTQNTVLFI